MTTTRSSQANAAIAASVTAAGADLNLDDLSIYFHMPIAQAAKEIGVCATVLKKICRKYVDTGPRERPLRRMFLLLTTQFSCHSFAPHTGIAESEHP